MLYLFRVLATLAATLIAFCSDWPAPHLDSSTSYSSGLVRSLQLLESSTPEHRKKVRILFYGQSITAQSWSEQVANDLRLRFPNADLVISNRAIPGFTSDLLVRTAEADLYPFYPDLLIFQVYGPTHLYEQIIARTRLRTTADILIQTDHPTLPSDLNEPTTASEMRDQGSPAWRNYLFLPALAERYHCQLADIRTPWKKYLERNELSPAQLLSDHIHLNEHGNFLMAELIKPHLSDHAPRWPNDQSAVHTFHVGASEAHWEAANTYSGLRLPFTGNRVDLIATNGISSPIKVRIDGRAPESFPELYTFTRTSTYPTTRWPIIMRLRSEAPLIEEEWTVRVIESQPDASRVRFTLTGSVTGADGTGSSSELFVSNSRRVVIQPVDWLLGVAPLPAGSEITFRSFCTAKSVFQSAENCPGENSQTVVQGLANGPHLLELFASGPTTLSGIRIYNPLLSAHVAGEVPRILSATIRGGLMHLNISASDRYIVERTKNWSDPWETCTSATEEPEITLPQRAAQEFYRVRLVDAF